MPPFARTGPRPLPHRARLLLLAGVSLGMVWHAPAFAQAPDDGSRFGGLMESLGLKAKATQAPAYVRRARPSEGSLQYMPVGAPRDAPPTKTMTPAEVATATDALDHARMAQQRRAGVKAVPVPLKAAKGGSGPKPAFR